MSHGTRLTDAERTSIMVDLLHDREHGEQQGEMPPSAVVLEEVAPGIGWSGGSRWADVLVLGMWRSQGQELDGYEIKASRSDLRRELAQPGKHRAVARYCDTWTLVIWSEAMLVEGVPEDWGIVVVDGDPHEHRLRVVRKAKKRTPDPWPRPFVCSLVRNAHQQSPRARWVARTLKEVNRRAVAEGKSYGASDVYEQLKPLVRAVRGEKTWDFPHSQESLSKFIAEASAALAQTAL